MYRRSINEAPQYVPFVPLPSIQTTLLVSHTLSLGGLVEPKVTNRITLLPAYHRWHDDIPREQQPACVHKRSALRDH